MNVDKLLHDLAGSIKEEMPSTSEAIRTFTEACRRTDDDLREQQRITEIANLLDIEESLHAEALGALMQGDQYTALPLLMQCAEAGTGEAAWLLAQLLEGLGRISEAMIWYQRAADDGDPRAMDKRATDKISRIPALHKLAVCCRFGGIRATLVTAGLVWRDRIRADLAWALATVAAVLILIGGMLGGIPNAAGTASPSTITSESVPPPVGPPPAPATVCNSTLGAYHGPALCMSFSEGLANAKFIVEGHGFGPQGFFTVTLLELSQANNPILSITTRVKPVIGPAGTFRISISQILARPLLLGQVTVTVIGSDGRRAATTFLVIPQAP